MWMADQLPGLQHDLDDQYAPILWHRFANILQELNRFRVILTHENAFDEIRIVARRHFGKEVAGNHLKSVTKALSSKELPRHLGRARQIEDCALQRGMRVQKVSKDITRPAAQVEDPAEPAERETRSDARP